MTIIIEDPFSEKLKFYVIDLSTRTSAGWCYTIDECIARMSSTDLPSKVYDLSLDNFIIKYPLYSIYPLEKLSSLPYEYW